MCAKRIVNVVKELLAADVPETLFNVIRGDVLGGIAGTDLLPLSLDEAPTVPVSLDD